MKVKELTWIARASGVPEINMEFWWEGSIDKEIKTEDHWSLRRKVFFVYHEKDGAWFLNAGQPLMEKKVECADQGHCERLAKKIFEKYVLDLIEEGGPNETNED